MENRASNSAQQRTPSSHQPLSYTPSRPFDPQHDNFFRATTAAKYHALWPHFVGQETLASCSVASAACVINAVMTHAGHAPISQQELLDTDPTGNWARAVEGAHATGVGLMQLAVFMRQAFAAQHFNAVALDVVHVLDCTLEAQQQLEATLRQGEAHPYNHFTIINFQQSAYLDDGAKDGHLSVVGAHDSACHETLVLDVDSQHFRPYWVPVENLLRGLASRRPRSGLPRGYLTVHVFADGF